MKTGHFLLFFIIPISLEECCEKHHPKISSGVQQKATHHHYRAVEGEMFMIPCANEAVTWSRIEDGKEVMVGKHNNLMFPRVETKHSGNYSCNTGSPLSSGFFHLQVVKNTSLRCSDPKENSVTVGLGQSGHIPCPGRNCSDNTNIIWYKGNKSVSEMRRLSRKEDGKLCLAKVLKCDTAVFFCDREITERGITWVFRRSVQVTVIPIIVEPPRVTYPEDNKTEEVELGRNHTLICEAQVPTDRQSEPRVQWYMNYNGSMVNMKQHERIKENVTFSLVKVTEKAVIKNVTLLDLNHTYTCVATNKVGSSSATIKLKKKIKVQWQSLVGYAVGSLLFIAGLGLILHVKWLELQLIYRSHWPYEKHDAADKKYDVFLSYVRNPPSAQMEGGSTPSSSSGPEHAKKICPSIMVSLKTENAMKPLEEQIPQVLEDEWGFRLCLLDRDILPGGAFTNEVAHAIQHSQMLICLLSADYLSNSNAVFVLESGIQALLQKWNLKLLLIWTDRDSTSLIQLDPPLPTLVRRALKVLPSLDWTFGTTGYFWVPLRKLMPYHKVQSAKGDFLM